METNNERRLRKLIEVCAAHGGYVAVAKGAKLNPASLDQIIKRVPLPKKGDGSRSERALGDAAARAIEEAYKLGRGWFDNDGEEASMSPNELQLLGLFRAIEDQTLQKVVLDNVRAALEQRADLIARMKGPAREKSSYKLHNPIVGQMDQPDRSESNVSDQDHGVPRKGASGGA